MADTEAASARVTTEATLAAGQNRRTDSTHHPIHGRDYAMERLTMLSDGVFAIAMTLLALDVRPPDGWDHTFQGLLRGLEVPIQAFFWSFFATASFWITHRRLFGVFREADAVLTVLNMILLGEITLIPVATRVLASLDYSTASLAIYLGLFGIIGATNAASWLYATSRPDLVAEPVGIGRRLAVAVVQFTVPVGATALGVLSPFPGLHWLPLLIPPLLAAAGFLRRAALRYDGRQRPATPTAAKAAN